MELSNNEPTLTAFVSRNNDEQKTYKSGDNVYFKMADKDGNGTLKCNGWSIYKDGSKFMDVFNESLSSKKLTMSLNTRGQNNSTESLIAFVSKDSDEKNTLNDGDIVNFNGARGEGIGELRFNGWYINEINKMIKIMDIDNKSLLSKELTMTLDTSDHPLTVENRQLTGYSPYGSYYGGKRSRRRSKRSRKSRKSKR